jgi:arsenate reductase
VIGLKDIPKDSAHRQNWLTAMTTHPKLIQRPIITATDGTTVVARDPESLAKVIDAG